MSDSSSSAASHSSMPTFDIVGVGVGPFNLGMAALCQPLVESGELSVAFFEQRSGFIWHPGMLLPEATIQVPFMADLVTMADPTSRYSFLNYLKQSGRIHQFYIREDFYPLRREYSDYCTWVAGQLDSVHFDSRVKAVRPNPEGDTPWLVDVTGHGTIAARHVVSGVGTTPFVPEELHPALDAEGVIHSADYLHNKEWLAKQASISIVGSGQSAAEIYADLLCTTEAHVDWFTRSERFFPMEYTKLTLEMTSPEYASYFRRLPEAKRDELNRNQRNLYKGISGETINAIYDLLYRLSLDGTSRTTLRAGVSAACAPNEQATDGSTGRHRLRLHHAETDTSAVHATDAVILCTGYKAPQMPQFLEPCSEFIAKDATGRMDVGEHFQVDADNTLFVLNADEHVHSLNAPDLGMGPWRNSIILREICGREVYPVEKNIAFQTFGGF